jgi:dsRNA-specific ribonuclease
VSDYDAAQTSQQIQTIGNNEALASLCDSAGLTPFINRNPSDLYTAPRTKAATIEAVVGAAYKHDGMICAAQVMRNLNII